MLKQSGLLGSVCVAVLAMHSLAAQESIRFAPATQVFRIDTPATTYAMGVNAQGELQALYWGAAIALTDQFLLLSRDVSFRVWSRGLRLPHMSFAPGVG